MKTQTLDTLEASNKYAAYMNARVRSYAASTSYSDQEKIAAERMKVVLSIVYMFKDIYVTYRKKFITVKLEQARVSDRVSLSELEAEWTAKGISKAVTPQGIIYRIPKA